MCGQDPFTFWFPRFYKFIGHIFDIVPRALLLLLPQQANFCSCIHAFHWLEDSVWKLISSCSQCMEYSCKPNNIWWQRTMYCEVSRTAESFSMVEIQWFVNTWRTEKKNMTLVRCNYFYWLHIWLWSESKLSILYMVSVRSVYR